MQIAWKAGTPHTLTFDQEMIEVRTGAVAQLTVRAVDRYGNAAVAPITPISWSWSGAGAVAGDPVTDLASAARARGASLAPGETLVSAMLQGTSVPAWARIRWI